MFSTLILSLILSANTNCHLLCDQIDAISASAKSCSMTSAYYGGKTPSSNNGTGSEQGENSQVDNKHLQKKQSPKARPVDKKRVSDLNPADPSPLLDGWLQTGDGRAILLADRWSSLHPEQDYNSSSYSGRRAPGPDHGDDPHGGDLHDEVHDAGLPANQANKDYYPNNKDPYGGTVPR
jgi:hypothetical protein